MESPHLDWCAHTFMAQRYRYLLLTNTHSFLSVVTTAKGVTSEDTLIRAALAALRDYLVASGRGFAFERLIAPQAGEVRFARIPDRRVLGTMNELIFLATGDLIEGGCSAAETSDRLNRVPLSALWRRGETSSAGPAFDLMPPRLE